MKYKLKRQQISEALKYFSNGKYDYLDNLAKDILAQKEDRKESLDEMEGRIVKIIKNWLKEDRKECLTCGHVKKSNPTPDGDEICPYCGGDCLDYEPKELDWEKEFDKQFDKMTFTTLYMNGVEPDRQRVKNFINTLLTQQRTELENQKVKVVWNDVCKQIKQEARTELLEEIKKLKIGERNENDGDDRSWNKFTYYYNQALEQVKNLLNKKDESIR